MADDKLESLPPEERIKKLKKLEEEKKKEIEEAHKLIKQSEDELTDRKKWEDKVPIPQVAREDLTSLSREEKDVLKAHKNLKEEIAEEETVDKIVSSKIVSETDLETLASEKSAFEIPPEVLNSQYAQHLGQKPVQDLYKEMMQIKEEVEEKGYISADKERRVEYLMAGVENKFEDEELGSYSFTEKAVLAANITQQIGAQLKSLYKSSSDGGRMYKAG